LISRFYEPKEGQILLDGVDISTLDPTWLRQQIGLVSQEVTLFSGTILENIGYANPKASQAEIEEAARQANAHGMLLEIVLEVGAFYWRFYRYLDLFYTLDVLILTNYSRLHLQLSKRL
jgi:ABC-type multidrug transport system fused ATPase/permease subunit